LEKNYDLTFRILSWPGPDSKWGDSNTWVDHMFFLKLSEVTTKRALAIGGALLIEDTHDFEEKVYRHINCILKMMYV